MQRVSNLSIWNQHISTPTHSIWYKSKNVLWFGVSGTNQIKGVYRGWNHASKKFLGRYSPFRERWDPKCSSEYKSGSWTLLTGLFSNGSFEKNLELRPVWIPFWIPMAVLGLIFSETCYRDIKDLKSDLPPSCNLKNLVLLFEKRAVSEKQPSLKSDFRVRLVNSKESNLSLRDIKDIRTTSIYIYIYIYVHTYIYVYVYIYIYICVCVRVCEGSDIE